MNHTTTTATRSDFLAALPRLAHWRAQVMGDGETASRVVGTLFGAAGYAVVLAALLVAGAFGLVAGDRLGVVVLLGLAGAVGFYLLVRFGWDENLDAPGLVMPQLAYALLWLGLAHALLPDVRDTARLVAAAVLALGAFADDEDHPRELGWFALGVFALSMGVLLFGTGSGVSTPRAVFDFALFSAVYLVVGHVAGLHCEARLKVRRQQAALEDALERARVLATSDDLTGLPNRRRALDALAESIDRSRRQDTPLCVARLDLDHLQRVNDEHGPAVGDRILHHVAECARPLLRSTDLLARWGSDDFVLLLPDTELSTARAVLERICAEVGRTPPCEDLPGLSVSLSGGITAFQRHETSEQALERSTQLLNKAKAQGRDRVIWG